MCTVCYAFSLQTNYIIFNFFTLVLSEGSLNYSQIRKFELFSSAQSLSMKYALRLSRTKEISLRQFFSPTIREEVKYQLINVDRILMIIIIMEQNIS